MTPDELRALADALEPMASAPRFVGLGVPAFCEWLRAQADAQPVAAVPAGWKPVPVDPTPEMLSAVGMMDGYDWHAPGCSPDADHANWYSAMIAAAPAAPQAAPMADSDADYWLRNRQPILDAIERAGFMLMSNASGFWLHPRGATDAQAEPKRGLTCLWSRADDDTDVWETSCGHAFTIIDGTPGDNHMEFCCYCGRPLEQEIGGSDAE